MTAAVSGGDEVFDLIERHPDRLQEPHRDRTQEASKIIAGWAEQKVVREIMLFLHANGVATAMELELRAGDVVADDVDGRLCIFLEGLYQAERAIAERLHVVSAGSPPWPAIDVNEAIPWVQARTGLELRREPGAGDPASGQVEGCW